jgi:hypothetical protein
VSQPLRYLPYKILDFNSSATVLAIPYESRNVKLREEDSGFKLYQLCRTPENLEMGFWLEGLEEELV